MHGGLVDLLSGMPGLKPPPANVAPPRLLIWLPMTPSIVVSTGTQGTLGFQDTGLVPDT